MGRVEPVGRATWVLQRRASNARSQHRTVERPLAGRTDAPAGGGDDRAGRSIWSSSWHEPGVLVQCLFWRRGAHHRRSACCVAKWDVWWDLALAWLNQVLFYAYSLGDSGGELEAWRQPGWIGLIAGWARRSAATLLAVRHSRTEHLSGFAVQLAYASRQGANYGSNEFECRTCYHHYLWRFR